VVLTATSFHDLFTLTEQTLGYSVIPVDMLVESGLDLDAPCAIALTLTGKSSAFEPVYAAAARVADPDRLRAAIQNQPDWGMFGAQAWSEGQTLTLHGDWVVLGTAPGLMRPWGQQLAGLDLPQVDSTMLYVHPQAVQSAWPSLVDELASRYGWGKRVRDTAVWLAQAFDGETPLVAQIERAEDEISAKLTWHHAHHPNLEAVLGDPAQSYTVEEGNSTMQLALSGAAHDIVLAMLRDEATGTADPDAIAYAERLDEAAEDTLLLGWNSDTRWLALRGGAKLDGLCREYLPVRPDGSVVIGQPAFYRYEAGFAVLASQPQSPQPVAKASLQVRWALRWNGVESVAEVRDDTDIWSFRVTFSAP
jgi:hypothetical protein